MSLFHQVALSVQTDIWCRCLNFEVFGWKEGPTPKTRSQSLDQEKGPKLCPVFFVYFYLFIFEELWTKPLQNKHTATFKLAELVLEIQFEAKAMTKKNKKEMALVCLCETTKYNSWHFLNFNCDF